MSYFDVSDRICAKSYAIEEVLLMVAALVQVNFLRTNTHSGMWHHYVSNTVN
jgi:hypothetical protein